MIKNICYKYKYLILIVSKSKLSFKNNRHKQIFEDLWNKRKCFKCIESEFISICFCSKFARSPSFVSMETIFIIIVINCKQSF